MSSLTISSNLFVKQSRERILRKTKEAMIKQMRLLNMLVMCGQKAPVVVSACDCIVHMVDRKEKEAEYLMNFFQEKVE